MSEHNTWIAECRLEALVGSAEFDCQAVVWAEDATTLRTRLAAYVSPLGYCLVRAADCEPLELRMRLHEDPYWIGTLGRAVHAGNMVALGPLVAATPVEDPQEPATPSSYLDITTIEDIAPLDDQFGLWPRKTIPDQLREPLFGQPEPTVEEIGQYGAVEAVPPMRTYIVLDSGKLQWGYSELEESGLPHQCLFKGDAAEDLKDAAPYLVELNPENAFTERLFKFMPGMSEDVTSVHLWHKEPGVYIRTRLPFADLWKHLRRFPRMSDGNGKWYFFRFWEPCVMRDYLNELRSDVGQVMNWFGRQATALTIVTIAGGVLNSYALAGNVSANQRMEPIRLEQAALARQHARRAMEEFAAEENIPFEWSTYEAYDYPWHEFELEDLKIIVLLHGYFHIMDKYPVDGMYPPEMQHEATRDSLLGRLIFFKAQGVPYGL